jgi:hypothetical protein
LGWKKQVATRHHRNILAWPLFSQNEKSMIACQAIATVASIVPTIAPALAAMPDRNTSVP